MCRKQGMAVRIWLLRFAYFCENREISKNRHVTGALAKQQIDVAQVQRLLGAIQSQSFHGAVLNVSTSSRAMNRDKSRHNFGPFPLDNPLEAPY
jgi:hypothetical protein